MTNNRHRNVPIFIPHLGCPHRCTFCDQQAISGHGAFDETGAIREMAEKAATLPPDAGAEIAFFGGSFTAINRGLMHRLLRAATALTDGRRIKGIRFSTRPDAVEEALLEELAPYPILAIELGLQSMDDRVLALTRRGHTVAVARDACRRIVRRGYPLVGQMMVGLPGATPETELETARELCALGVSAVRIYPVVVFEGTALATAYRAGEYCPPDSEAAAVRCVPLCRLFEENGIAILRVGLCESETLHSARALAGATHPALGELVRNAAFAEAVTAALDAVGARSDGQESFEIYIPQGRLSQVLGQHRRNVTLWQTAFPGARFHFTECDWLDGTRVTVRKKETYSTEIEQR